MKVVKMFLVSVVLSWSFIGHVHTPVCVEYRKLHILVPSDCKIAYNVPHLANQKSNGIAEICWSIFRAYCVKLVIVCVCVCVCDDDCAHVWSWIPQSIAIMSTILENFMVQHVRGPETSSRFMAIGEQVSSF